MSHDTNVLTIEQGGEELSLRPLSIMDLLGDVRDHEALLIDGQLIVSF